MYSTGVTPHALVDLAFERRVVGVLEPGRDDDLQERDLRRELRTPFQHALERAKLVRHALRVVEPLDAEDQPATAVAVLQLLDEARRPRGGERAFEALHVDADRMDADADTTSLEADPVVFRGEPQDPEAGGAEVARVVVRVEADVVAAEHAEQQVLARRQQTVDLGRRERDVQEEADLQVRPCLAQQPGHEHQVEVVDPDARALRRRSEDRVREALVDLDVALPRAFLEVDLVDEVVEQRPDRLVGDAVVVELLVLLVEEDGDQPLLGEPFPDLVPPVLGHRAAGPADPVERRTLGHALQRRRQSPRRARRVELAIGEAEAHREAVARDPQRSG